MPDIGRRVPPLERLPPKRIPGFYMRKRGQRLRGETGARPRNAAPFAAWWRSGYIAPEAPLWRSDDRTFIVPIRSLPRPRLTFRGTRILVADSRNKLRGGPGDHRRGMARDVFPMPSRKRRGWRTRRFAIIPSARRRSELAGAMYYHPHVLSPPTMNCGAAVACQCT